MNGDNPHAYQGYPMLPVTDPQSGNVIGWDVPYLNKSFATFATKDQAQQAIDNRIAEVIRDLQGRMGQ